MNTYEAFRIRLGSVVGERPIEADYQRALNFEREVRRVLKPLGLSSRLQFFLDFEISSSSNWFVVKVEASKQLSLLTSIDDEGVEEPELARECRSALGLARDALAVLRKLSAAARMTPYQFHRILEEDAQLATDGMCFGRLVDSADQLVLVRDPQGQDTTAHAPEVPSRVTLAESHQISFHVEMVGKTSALVCQVKIPGCRARGSRRTFPFHWGGEAEQADLFRLFLSALEEDREITTWARKTVNKNGVLMRLEWVQDPETLN